LVDPLDDFFTGLAEGHFELDRNVCGFELGPHLFQIRAAFLHFFTAGVLFVKLGCGSGGDVEQHDVTMHDMRKLFDVINDGPVGGRQVQGQENLVVHLCRSPMNRTAVIRRP